MASLFPADSVAGAGKSSYPATVSEFIESAMENAPGVREARMELEMARAERRGAGIWSNPAFDAEALNPHPDERGYKTSIGLVQPLSVSFRRCHAVKAADFRISAAKYRLEEARWQASSDAVVGLVRLRQIGREIGLAREALELCDMALEKSGKPAFLTDEQAMTRQAFIWRREAMGSRTRLLENEAGEVKERLAVLVGGRMSQEWNFTVPFREEWPAWPVVAGANPALAGIKAEAEAEKAGLAFARAKAIPDISVGPYLETEPGAGGSGMSRDWGARISLDIPIFDRNQGEISSRAAGKKRTEEVLEAAESNMSIRMKSLGERYRRSVERLVNVGKSLREAEGLIEDVKSRYLSGRVSAPVVLEVLGSYQEAVEESHSLERDAHESLWEGCYLSGLKEVPKP